MLFLPASPFLSGANPSLYWRLFCKWNNVLKWNCLRSLSLCMAVSGGLQFEVLLHLYSCLYPAALCCQRKVLTTHHVMCRHNQVKRWGGGGAPVGLLRSIICKPVIFYNSCWRAAWSRFQDWHMRTAGFVSVKDCGWCSVKKGLRRRQCVTCRSLSGSHNYI